MVLEHSVVNISTVNDIFVTIGDIYRYMEGSPERHAVYESDLPAKDITNGKKSLHAYSDTRWTARSDNLEVVLDVFPTLLSMMEEQSNTGDNVATGLLVRLTTFRFMASCIVLKECFSSSRSASE